LDPIPVGHSVIPRENDIPAWWPTIVPIFPNFPVRYRRVNKQSRLAKAISFYYAPGTQIMGAFRKTILSGKMGDLRKIYRPSVQSLSSE
jgi:hypothetical protein